MGHGAEAVTRENPTQGRGIANISGFNGQLPFEDALQAGDDRRVAVAEIVEYDGSVAAFSQRNHQVAADESGTARYQDLDRFRHALPRTPKAATPWVGR